MTPERSASSSKSGGVALVLWGLLGVWTLLPLATLVIVSLTPGGWRWPALLPDPVGLEAWTGWVGRGGGLGGALGTSLALALACGALSAPLGALLGRALARAGGPPARLGAALAFLPVVAPPLALAVGLHATLLTLGLGGRGVGVLVAHLVPAVGYTTLFFMGVFDALDDRVEATARRLGASTLQRLVWVTLPLVRRPLAEAFALGFLISWAQVPLTLLVGQGRVRTLTVEVLSLVQAGQDPQAAAGALLLTAPPLAILGVVALGVRAARVVVA